MHIAQRLLSCDVVFGAGVQLMQGCVSSQNFRQSFSEGQRHWSLVPGQNSFCLMVDVF